MLSGSKYIFDAKKDGLRLKDSAHNWMFDHASAKEGLATIFPQHLTVETEGLALDSEARWELSARTSHDGPTATLIEGSTRGGTFYVPMPTMPFTLRGGCPFVFTINSSTLTIKSVKMEVLTQGKAFFYKPYEGSLILPSAKGAQMKDGKLSIEMAKPGQEKEVITGIDDLDQNRVAFISDKMTLGENKELSQKCGNPQRLNLEAYIEGVLS